MPDDENVNPGSSYSWDVDATDDDITGTLTFSLVSVSPEPTNDFSIDTTTGVVSWNPTCDDIDDGDTTYTITVSVNDGCTTVQDSFTVTLLAEQCPGIVNGKIRQHNGNGYGQATAHFKNINTGDYYFDVADGNGDYSIDLPSGSYVFWADKLTGKCASSIGYYADNISLPQYPNGYICITVSAGSNITYDIWVNNIDKHDACPSPPINACQ
jgi:hypothetical protein